MEQQDQLQEAIDAWSEHFQQQEQNKEIRRKKVIYDSPEQVKENIQFNDNSNINSFQQISQYKKRIRLRQQLQEDCPICMCNLDELENICELDPCRHQICQKCISEWAQKYKAQCPCCRVNFKKIWPLNNGNRQSQELRLKLKCKKWKQDEDEFYQEQLSICMMCKCTFDQDLLLICDRCQVQCCHTFCDPGLIDYKVPDGMWYCLDCRKSRLKPQKHR